MERVTGIGGVFFRAKDPQTLALWYEHHLGVRQTGQTYAEGSWWQDEGPTVSSRRSTTRTYPTTGENARRAWGRGGWGTRGCAKVRARCWTCRA